MGYESKIKTKVITENLSDNEDYLLNKSKYFCMLPWTHLHAFPNGEAYPCCLSEHKLPIGSLKKNSLKELWNSNDMKEMRQNMMNESPCKQCVKCYEQE